jgi:replicative DNA helicase
MNMVHVDPTAVPCDIEVEKRVLGTVMRYPEMVFELTAKLRPEHFFSEANRRIFSCIACMQEREIPIDDMAVSTELKALGQLDSVGGFAYLFDLTEHANVPTPLARRIGVLSERYQERMLLHAAEAAMLAVREKTATASEIGAALMDSVLSIQITGTGLRLFHDVMAEAVIKLTEFRNRPDTGALGLTTTVEGLDVATTAIREDEFWIVGARPNVGKTPFACQVAIAQAQQGVPVLMFTLEMADYQLAWRILSHAGMSKPHHVRDPRYASATAWRAIAEAPETVKHWPLYVDDTPGISISELKHRVRHAVARYGVKLVIDYLQLISAPGKGGYERVSNVARGLQQLCRQTHCPVLALSQLNREAKDLGKEPVLGDLRESGELEQNANVVLLLHRPPEVGESTPGKNGKIIAAKVREGKGGAVDVHFDERTLTFGEGWVK